MRKSMWMLLSTLAIIVTFGALVKINVASAEEKIISIPVSIFESDEHYDFSNSVPVLSMTFGEKTLGELQITGEVSGTAEYQGVPGYGVEKGNLAFSYCYDGSLLDEADDQWHLTEDSGKSVDGFNLNNSIGNGVLFVQTSADGTTWTNAIDPVSNFLSDNQNGVKAFYTALNSDINSGISTG